MRRLPNSGVREGSEGTVVGSAITAGSGIGTAIPADRINARLLSDGQRNRVIPFHPNMRSPKPWPVIDTDAKSVRSNRRQRLTTGTQDQHRNLNQIRIRMQRSCSLILRDGWIDIEIVILSGASRSFIARRRSRRTCGRLVAPRLSRCFSPLSSSP